MGTTTTTTTSFGSGDLVTNTARLRLFAKYPIGSQKRNYFNFEPGTIFLVLNIKKENIEKGIDLELCDVLAPDGRIYDNIRCHLFELKG